MMKRSNETPRRQMPNLGRLIWGNIVRQQYLLGITDTQLCEALGITSRTLQNYRRDPSAITIRQLERLLSNFGTDAESLLKS
ncbi:MAG: helix-turn-helix domain-containing protein [Oscillospiraceae bacterium]|nr:helix-turn-helix domain-containing protein [Oscillospiraceae bacterium]